MYKHWGVSGDKDKCLKEEKNAPSKEWKIGACNVEDSSSSFPTFEDQ